MNSSRIMSGCPYTVNSAADWARLTETGVDGVITDRAGAFIGWKQVREQEAPARPRRRSRS
ncbi:MAG: glycerophosphodiester phosphodiesterase family protein [Cellulosimicrobium cellulans]